MPKIVNAALKTKAKVWSFKAKAKAKVIKLASRSRPGLEDYITGSMIASCVVDVPATPSLLT